LDALEVGDPRMTPLCATVASTVPDNERRSTFAVLGGAGLEEFAGKDSSS
jgi:hypothetical protein